MFFTDLSLCQRLAFASFHTSNAIFFSLGDSRHSKQANKNPVWIYERVVLFERQKYDTSW